ncbi:MAG TPA: hypothetical protein VHM90_19070 [Phycisphaerae bacterium]|nr:hypothetical protein [Phycisphaerae bacterium]
MDAMELIRKYFVQIKSQLVGLTISQKLLIGLLAVVMVATIFFTVVWSAKPQMVPVIPQAMTAEDIAKAQATLATNKHQYQIVGDKILVPADDLYAIRGELMTADALPKNLATAFAAMIREASPFTTDAMNTRAWNNALQMELTRWLQSFPYVQTGNVIVNMGQQSALGRPAIVSSAAVYIATKDGKDISSSQLMCIVEWVSGTVPGLKREDVRVIVNGQQSHRGADSDTPVPGNLLEVKKQFEDELEKKLYRMFASMGEVKIAVNVDPDMSSKDLLKTIYDPTKSVVKAKQVVSRTSDSTDGTGAPGGEAGFGSNVTASASEPAATGRSSVAKTTDDHTENEVAIGSVVEKSHVPAATEWRGMSASISLPRSYFVSILKKRSGAGEPKDQKEEDKFVTDIINPELKRVVALAKNTIGAKADEQIQVDWYDDMIVAPKPDVVVAASGFGSGIAGISQYAKQGVLAVVALGVMGMMLMMVKRAVPAGAEDVDTGVFFGAAGRKGKKKNASGHDVETLEASDDVFGEANQGEAVLTGIELDDETLASRKMVDEVSTMIKENPENAAALVKRWMSKGK